jgi:hypothetical protein
MSALTAFISNAAPNCEKGIVSRRSAYVRYVLFAIALILLVMPFVLAVYFA